MVIREDGDKLIIENPVETSMRALEELIKGFEGVAEELGLKTDQDVVDLIKQVRRERREEKERLFKIRDEDDYIILHTAIIENVDIFITNDNDFSDVGVKRPKIMKPEEFNEKY